jgi:hypothetical protein
VSDSFLYLELSFIRDPFLCLDSNSNQYRANQELLMASVVPTVQLVPIDKALLSLKDSIRFSCSFWENQIVDFFEMDMPGTTIKYFDFLTHPSSRVC